MIVCKCGNKIAHFIAIAQRPWTSGNTTNRHIIIPNGSYLGCSSCAQQTVDSWHQHNKGRTQPYEIKTAKVNVTADTQREFFRRVLPQIISQFDWYVPKTDIQTALAGTIKAS